MRELIRRFRAWQNRRYWQAHQMEHLRLMLQEDGRWMAHNPIAAALTDRYLAATAEDWYQQVFVHSGHLREQLGLDPHVKREPARTQTASASCADHAGPLSVVGLGERDALSAADVDQPVAVAAAQAEEKASPLIDLGRDGSEHHLQPAGSALPHGESPATGAEESSTGELRTNDAAQPVAVPHVVAPHPELQNALFCYATGDDGASAILIRGWPALVAQVESEVARGDTPWSELLADLDYWSNDGWDVPHRYSESFEDGYMAIYRISEPAAQPASKPLTAETFLDVPDVPAEDSGINTYYSRDVVLACIQAAIDAAQPARAGGDAPILVTVGAMHQCRSTDKIDICAHCGAMAEELSKPCKAWLPRADAALAVAPQPAPTEPPLSLTLPIQAREIIDKLLELAAIVDRAVEDWGESLPDDSCIVTFHKDEAEKRDGVLEWLDALPDPDDESYVYNGPAKAAHILKTLIGKEGGVA